MHAKDGLCKEEGEKGRDRVTEITSKGGKIAKGSHEMLQDGRKKTPHSPPNGIDQFAAAVSDSTSSARNKDTVLPARLYANGD